MQRWRAILLAHLGTIIGTSVGITVALYGGVLGGAALILIICVALFLRSGR